ncbi:MAG: nucleotide sugar dehydrogenase [Hyphomicrobium sp.]|uniref:nucleotide sugar dehydrogenase n=1 Tax=Hyphomicrobium sp. TaxID=82 RepID=UPI003D1242F2
MRRRIAVVGLGYVGLPVAVAFAKAGFEVAGFDVDRSRVEELNRGYDRTRECTSEELSAAGLTATADPAVLAASDYYIVTVPTPIDDANRPDLSALIKASATVGSVLKKGDIVVYESTVYPGATEDDCVPVLERESGLKLGTDFGVGYSPERINPGDLEHRFETIKKVVSGSDPVTAGIVADTYGAVVRAGIYRASSIRVAEAAKVIENTQRDINIGFINELSAIFNRFGIDTNDVLDAASTKWNFLNFRPGLVGGHCIGVDPYYLTFQAERHGHHAEVILSGRRVNDGMGTRIARECIKMLLRQGHGGDKLRVTVLGLTFKEDVPDTRNSKVVDIVRELKSVGIDVQVHDPVADADAAQHEYGIALKGLHELEPADAMIFAVKHKAFLDDPIALARKLLAPGCKIIVDVKCVLDRTSLPPDYVLWRP